MHRLHLKSFLTDDPHGVTARLKSCTNTDAVMLEHALYLPGTLRVCDVEGTRQAAGWLVDIFVEPVLDGDVSRDEIRFANIGT